MNKKQTIENLVHKYFNQGSFDEDLEYKLIEELTNLLAKTTEEVIKKFGSWSGQPPYRVDQYLTRQSLDKGDK